jgi:hypothetical protein
MILICVDMCILGLVIDSLLDCGSHITNPIESSAACNGFVVMSLLRLPVEVFTRSQRERVMKAWPPTIQDSEAAIAGILSYKMTNLDPAVISLKMKIMQRPTLYEVSFPSLILLE